METGHFLVVITVVTGHCSRKRLPRKRIHNLNFKNLTVLYIHNRLLAYLDTLLTLDQPASFLTLSQAFEVVGIHYAAPK